MRKFKFNIFNRKPKVDVRSLKAPEISEKDTPDEVYIKLQNAIKELRNQLGDIDNGIDDIIGNDYRAITIQDWLYAIRAADVPFGNNYQPSWVELFDIYANLKQDTHIQGAIDTLDEGLQAKAFNIVDSKGKQLDDVTKLFRSEWFSDYLTNYLNTRLYGFGLIKLSNFDPSDYSLDVTEVNRKHVRPDLNGIVKQQYDQQVWRSWEKQPYKNWNIFVFHDKLGKLSPVVRWYIYKNEVARFWAKYNQSFGIPKVITKTNINDPRRKKNAIDMLKNWVKTGWGVYHTEDVIETASTGSGTGQEFFEKLIRLADEQISKALLGSTMVLDNGSSKSQADVHAQNTARFINSTARKIMYSVNKELIPRLRFIGLPIPKDANFIWDESEDMKMTDKADIVYKLSENYSIRPEVVSDFIGLEVEEKEPEMSQEIQNIINDHKKKLK